MATIKKKSTVGKDMEKLEKLGLLCPFGGNINWCSCYVKQFGGSFTN